MIARKGNPAQYYFINIQLYFIKCPAGAGLYRVAG